MTIILHLTDLHFGCEGLDIQKLANRDVCMDGILKMLRNVDQEWKPTVVAITGDLGWRASAQDYERARQWIDQLLEILSLTYASVVICPGNHDLDRNKAKRIPRPNDHAEADDVLSIPIAQHYEDLFQSYTAFCAAAKIPPFQIGQASSYIVGVREVGGVQFLCMNSCWSSKDDKDEKNLWLGLPHLKFLEANKAISLGSPGTRLTIAMSHHPREWLHEAEMIGRGRPSTWDYLAARSQVILTGHTHGHVRPPDRVAGKALHYTGGSAFAGDAHCNTFRILRLSGGRIDDLSCEFDAISSAAAWRFRDADSRPVHERSEEPVASARPKPESLSALRSTCRSFAEKSILSRSKLLKRSGNLPELTVRRVTLMDNGKRAGDEEAGSQDLRQVSLDEAVRGARRVMVWGDIGSGKSTLLADYACKMMGLNESRVAIYLPVKTQLWLASTTLTDFKTKIDAHLRRDVPPNHVQHSFDGLIAEQQDTVLILDGLDEIDPSSAKRLLELGEEATRFWPSLQVIATCRPIRIRDFHLDGWTEITCGPLSEGDIERFVTQELIAEGIPTQEVPARARSLTSVIRKSSSLRLLARSPLTVRLLFPHLAALVGSSLTLGDLLYMLLVAQLDWPETDDKPTDAVFQETYPTPEAKMILLSALAEATISGQPMTLDGAKALLPLYVPAEIQRPHLLVDAAIKFYEWQGLIAVTHEVDFSLQAINEIACAEGWERTWKDVLATRSATFSERWRVLSFVAAIGRRRQRLASLQGGLSGIVSRLIESSQAITAGCLIVAESEDPTLARAAITALRSLGFRPLTFALSERDVAAAAIAKTIVLAGDEGFDWLYEQYLDCKTPLINAGSAIICDVVVEWASLAHASLTLEQQNRLAQLVPIYKAMGEGCLFGILSAFAFCCPQAFQSRDLLWHLSFAFDHDRWASLALERFRSVMQTGRHHSEVQHVLSHRCGKSYTAALLWLETNPGPLIPVEVLFKGLEASAHQFAPYSAVAVAGICAERLGRERWMAIARWGLVDGSDTASLGAAHILFDSGNRNLAILGDICLERMHDGGFHQIAEDMLEAMVTAGGEKAVRWLVGQMNSRQDGDGAHSGWWRVLLPKLETLADGPGLLKHCASALGPYTIPRYAEVRNLFTHLLTCARGQAFREGLQSRLTVMDPSARRGAACILAACTPDGDAEALYCSLRMSSRGHFPDWSEWEAYMTTMKVAPSVIAYLESRIDSLPKTRRPLAKVIVEKSRHVGKLVPSRETLTMLLMSHQVRPRLDPDVRECFKDPRSAPILIDLMKEANSQFRSDAARKLYHYHVKSLAPAERAFCAALVFSSRLPDDSSAFSLLNLKKDPATLDLLESMADSKSEKKMSLLVCVASALRNPERWKEVIWRGLIGGGESMGHEAEDAALSIMVYARRNPADAAIIGQECRQLLSDDRLASNRWIDSYQWIALLAAEFGSLPGSEIQKAILHGQPIHCAAVGGLIARNGAVPAQFRPPRREDRCTCPAVGMSFTPPRRREEILPLLVEYGRNSAIIHADVSGLLCASLYWTPFDADELHSISSQGIPGELIALSLRYLGGLEIVAERDIPVVDGRSSLRFESSPGNKLLVGIWAMVKKMTFFDEDSARSYVLRLEREFATGSHWTLSIGLDLLQLRGGLRETEIGGVFAAYAEHASYLDAVMFVALTNWMMGNAVASAITPVIVAEATEAIACLDAKSLTRNEEALNTWACLFFPLTLWTFSDSTTASAERVFLLGLCGLLEKSAGPPEKIEHRRTRAIGLLAPMLARAKPDRLKQAIERGITAEEPMISGYCRLLRSLVPTRD